MILKEYDTKTVMREFIKFLKKERIFDLYYRNLENTDWRKVEEDNYSRYIKGAFDWADSNENHVFWEELNKKWLGRLLEEYKKKNELLNLI